MKQAALLGLTIVVLCSACALWTLQWGWTDVQFDPAEAAAVQTRVVSDSTGRGGLTLVAASLGDDTPRWFVLDTGTELAVLDDEVARALGLTGGDAIGIGCGLHAEVQRGAYFQLGPLIASDPVFLVLDLDPFLRDVVADIEIAGIVGHDLFQHAVVTFEYGPAGDRVYVYDPNDFQAPPDHWHAMQLVDDGPAVPGTVAGAGPGLFFLDTGKSGTASLSVPYITRYDLLDGRAVQPATNRRLCGLSDELEGTVDTLTIAGEHVVAPTVRFRLPGTEGGDANRVADAVVGREILKRFIVTFDYPGRLVRLVPNSSLSN